MTPLVTRSRAQAQWAVVAILVIVTLFVGCAIGGNRRSPGRVTATLTVAPPPSNPNAAELADFAVTFAYAQYWVALPLVDEQPPTRIRGALAAVAAGHELDHQVHLAQSRRQNHLRIFGETHPHVRLVTGAGTTKAMVYDCADMSATGLLDVTSGVRAAPGSSRTSIVAELERQFLYSNWHVTSVTVISARC